MIPRRSRTVPALILAVILAAAGVTVAIDVISVLAGGRPLIWPQRQIGDQLRANHWNDLVILVIAGLMALIGLLLLFAALTRGKQQLVPLATDDPEVTAGTTKRSLRNAISDAALGVDGVDRARVKLRSRKAKVKAHSALRDVTGVEEQVDQAVEERLAGIAPLRSIKVRTNLAYKED